MNIKILTFIIWYLLLANTSFAYGRQDTLRGSNGAGRYWWDVLHYDLSIDMDTAQRSISGHNTITLLVTDAPTQQFQIDLQIPMEIDSIKYGSLALQYTREENVWWVNTSILHWQKGEIHKITIYYHGQPRVARMPPWDGGFIWSEDSTGKPWYSVACQGLGASSWWPCKDYQAEEPDSGMVLRINAPKGLSAISNGRLLKHNETNNSWTWAVKNPINSYDATFYIGDYVSWKDTLMGEDGRLDLSFYVLRYNEAKAKKQFSVTKEMLHCFEYWMGPYPFYQDGYKLVEAPHLGMEHQSAVAYGNEYKMGYKGMDRSGTGVGLLFDFIIIHETGHEWFGNNITAADITDNWIHEGFTTYTEALFTECAFSKDKAFTYTIGERKNIRNDKPICGSYGIHDHGSGDQYDKGASIVHMIRVMMNNDQQFRQLLRDLNKDFYHSITTSKEVETYIAKKTGLQLAAFFDQYLRTNDIPTLEWYIKSNNLYYRFTNTVPEFSLPVTLYGRKKKVPVLVTNEWQHIKWKNGGYNVSYSTDYLIKDKD
ncbi:MAG: M1 family metallopeptidase [Flavipsychrobacter sp.]